MFILFFGIKIVHLERFQNVNNIELSEFVSILVITRIYSVYIMNTFVTLTQFNYVKLSNYCIVLQCFHSIMNA